MQMSTAVKTLQDFYHLAVNHAALHAVTIKSSKTAIRCDWAVLASVISRLWTFLANQFFTPLEDCHSKNTDIIYDVPQGLVGDLWRTTKQNDFQRD